MPVSSTTKFIMPERKDYDALPADMYQVQITDISEKLMPPFGKPFDIPDEEKETFINFEFTILDEGEHRGRKLWKAVRPVPPTPPESNKFKPSWMYRIVSAVSGGMTYSSGIDWGAEETNAMIGKQLRVTVTRTEKGEKAYNNITEVLSAKTSLPPIEANNEPADQPKAETASPGFDKFKKQAEAIGAGKNSMAGQNEPPIAADIAEEAARIEAGEDVNVEDVPF